MSELETAETRETPASDYQEVFTTPFPNNFSEKENQMADVDTQMLSNQHGDIRREQAAYAADIRYDVAARAGDIRREGADHTSEIRYDIGQGTNEAVKETLKAGWHGVDATKDARHNIINEVDRQGDRVTDQNTAYFISGQQYAFQTARDVAALKATTDMGLQKLGSDILTQGALGQAASALESAKVAAAVALGQGILERTIMVDGQKTRDLINDHKYHDLNRALVERNAELVEERESRRHWRHTADQNQFQGQWASLQSQIQAFQSQLQDTRQGMVNFGSMSGQSGQQTSTSNNVR